MDVNVSVLDYLGEAIEPQAFVTPLPDAAAAEVVEQLRQEAERHWGINPHRSLELTARIIAIGEARRDLRQMALGWMARGDALRLSGRTSEAWEALEQAGEMFAAAGEETGWARTRIGRLYLCTMLNRVPEALDGAERARAILLQHGEQDKLLRLDFATAYVHNYLGDSRRALELYRSALATAEGFGAAGEAYIGPLYTNMGSAYEMLGDLRQAKDYYERAYALFEARGETLHLATAQTNIAYLAQAQGDYRRALRLLNQSLEAAQEESDLESTQIKSHLLGCYLGLNRLSEARDLARQVAGEYRQMEDAFELGRALLQLAMTEAGLANFETALRALDEAEDIFTSLGASTWTATAWLRRGRIALLQGHPTAAYEKAAAAREIFHTAGKQVDEATTALLQGQALLALENPQAAADAGRLALRTARQYRVPSLRYTAHLLLGQVFESQSSLLRANQHYQAAAATTERVQRGLTITLRPGFLEDKTEAWRALIGLHLRGGKDAGTEAAGEEVARAFEILERAKSQVLFGYLANRERLRWARDDEISRKLIEELDMLRAEHQWFYRLAHEAPQEPDHLRPEQVQEAINEVTKRERRMRAITEQLYLNSPEGSNANPTHTPSAEEVQESLEDDSLLIEYYNDGSQLWAFTLDRRSIDVQRLSISPEKLNQLVAQLQVNITGALKIGQGAPALGSLTELAQRILGKLYSSLVEPLGERIKKANRSVIVPYGALHFLPFHLLYDGAAYLIERQEVVTLPAAGLALQPGPRRPPGALILAHSWEGRLPYTYREAEIVQELFGGSLQADEAANRSSFQAAPKQILHIAAHGEYRLDQPDLSYIQLADGQLYADDLLQQDLSYELVTLSACETGRANVTGGEELIGLGRGFLYAGAGALLLSLWPVPDAITVRLMEQVYLALRRGASKAAAIRDAQRAISAETRRLHPAFWGAFQLVGNAEPLTMDEGRRLEPVLSSNHKGHEGHEGSRRKFL